MPYLVRAGLLVGLLLVQLAAAAPVAAQDTDHWPSEEETKADRLRQEMRQMVTMARDRVFPSLVNIRVITVNYWGGMERKAAGVGSGTVISRDGYVVTNYHVVRNGTKFTVTLANKQEIPAVLVGEDPLTDLAVIKLDLSVLEDPEEKIPVANFGDSDSLEIGDTVMAMGSPWALSRSVSLGIVSNTERILTGGDDDFGEMYFDRDQRTGLFNRWIQHDAAINPGNSGGPLVNLKGEVIGVNTRGQAMGGDMGFAIPSNMARSVATILIEKGEVPRSWIGLSFKPIKKTGMETGVLVNSVTKDGPAAKAGIQAGDVIESINGRGVTVWFPEEVPPLLKDIADHPIGSTVEFAYRRDGVRRTASVVTEKLLRDRGEEAAFRAWGITAMDITPRMARQRRLDVDEGVLLSSVRGGSPAQLAEPPLMSGDIIQTIAGEKISTLAGLIAYYEQITDTEDLPEYLLVEFNRRGKNQLTLLKPEPDKDEDPPREVAKAWIGVSIQPVVKRLARQLGHPDAIGFRVTRIYPHTVAAESDIRVGDIILSINAERIKPRRVEDSGLFQRKVRRLDIDDAATLTVLRDGVEQDIQLTLERTRITPGEARRDLNRDFELSVRELTFFDRDDFRWEDGTKGVLVESVESAGWAGLGGLRSYDLIQRIEDFEITGLKSYRHAMEEISKQQPERVVFVVLRGVSTNFQYVEPEWKPVVTGDAHSKE